MALHCRFYVIPTSFSKLIFFFLSALDLKQFKKRNILKLNFRLLFLYVLHHEKFHKNILKTQLSSEWGF